METKHALKTKVGIQEKKIEKMKAQLDVEPKSAVGEASKESARQVVSMVAGGLAVFVVKLLYIYIPVMTKIEPDTQLVVNGAVFLFTFLGYRFYDKFIYQVNKNKGEVATPVGIDGTAVALASLFSRKKTQPVQADENKK